MPWENSAVVVAVVAAEPARQLGTVAAAAVAVAAGAATAVAWLLEADFGIVAATEGNRIR